MVANKQTFKHPNEPVRMQRALPPITDTMRDRETSPRPNADERRLREGKISRGYVSVFNVQNILEAFIRSPAEHVNEHSAMHEGDAARKEIPQPRGHRKGVCVCLFVCLQQTVKQTSQHSRENRKCYSVTLLLVLSGNISNTLRRSSHASHISSVSAMCLSVCLLVCL